MALIKCPECGRNNVSSSAMACPNCGYPIKDSLLTQEKDNYTEEQTTINTDTVNNDDNSVVKENKALTIKCKNCNTLYSDNICQCPSCGYCLSVSDYFDITDYIDSESTQHNKMHHNTTSTTSFLSNESDINTAEKTQFNNSSTLQENIARTNQYSKTNTQNKNSSKKFLDTRKVFWAFIVIIILLGILFLGSGNDDNDDRTCAWCNGTGYNGNGAQSVEEYVFKKTPCKHCGGKGTY